MKSRLRRRQLKAAAGNESSGKEVMTLLPNRRGDEVKITKEAVKATVANFWSSESVRQLLFNYCYSRFTIEELLRAAVMKSQ
jgi:hypothetical protein